MNAQRQRIAVVGSGVAGLVCAHVLGPHHDVTVYEADARPGGHANTVEVDDPLAGTLAVDTGFIVHNDRNYPGLVRLFNELDVPTFDTEMSFSVTDRDPSSATAGFSYRATSVNTLFADRRNVATPAMWRMLRDIARFYRHANAFLSEPDPTTTLRHFLAAHRYSRDFVELHLLPMGAAVWSADPSTFDDFPARSLLTFLRHHGLLGFRNRPQWKSIHGGSRVYVEALLRRFAGTVRLASPVREVRRTEDGVTVCTDRGPERHDTVVSAVHSDQALRIFADASNDERSVLSAVRYQPNTATLHTDVRLMPPHRRAWAAWNYERRGTDQGQATLTYDMTTLQHLPGKQRYLVSLNSDEFIDEHQVIARFQYHHPVYDLQAIRAQQALAGLQGQNHTYFCGAWCGNGFHEDGVASALNVCAALGVPW